MPSPRMVSIRSDKAPPSRSVVQTPTANEKTLPRPAFDDAHKIPPYSSTSDLDSARPKPVPPNVRFVDRFACSNGSKIRVNTSRVMPTPVSSTSKRRYSFPFARSKRFPSPDFSNRRSSFELCFIGLPAYLSPAGTTFAPEPSIIFAAASSLIL
eukprot:31013-Pelagococcus_subviridis.AAC.1